MGRVFFASLYQKKFHHGRVYPICRGLPRHSKVEPVYTVDEYRDLVERRQKLLFLAPPQDLLDWWNKVKSEKANKLQNWEQFRERYKTHFSAVIEQVKRFFEWVRLQEFDVTLVCWEKAGDEFCHRNFVHIYVQKFYPDIVGGCDVEREPSAEEIQAALSMVEEVTPDEEPEEKPPVPVEAHRCIIAGSRGITDTRELEKAIANANFNIIEVVSGDAANSPDRLGETWARKRDIPVRKFPADWNNIQVEGASVKTGKDGRPYNAKAGMDRNRKMAEYGTALIALWDGKSPGTKEMIKLAQQAGLVVYVWNVVEQRGWFTFGKEPDFKEGHQVTEAYYETINVPEPRKKSEAEKAAKKKAKSQDRNQIDLFTEPEPELEPWIITMDDPRWDAALQQWDQASVFACDIETYGPKPLGGLDHYNGFIRLIQVGLESGEVIVADLGGWDQAERDRNQAKLRETGFFDILERKLGDPGVEVVGQNFYFDGVFIRFKLGYKVRCVRDTMLMSQVLWAGLPRSHFGNGLADICHRLELAELDKSEQVYPYGEAVGNKQLNYAGKDVRYLIPAARKMQQLLEESKHPDTGRSLWEPAKIECDALPAWIEITYNGLPVDYERLDYLSRTYSEYEQLVLQPFHELFPNLNPRSKAANEAIRIRYGIQAESLEGTGIDELAPYWDFPPLRAKSVAGSIATYKAYLDNAASLCHNGRVRGYYRPLGPSAFGRSTCGDKGKGINLQNPPNPANVPDELKALGFPKLKTAFKPEPGRKFLVCDLSQAHARIAAEASLVWFRDKKIRNNLVASYLEGIDTHCVTASALARLKGLGQDWTAENIDKWKGDANHPNHELASKLRSDGKPAFYGCVPLDTQALTRYGWKTYYELTVGDEILAYHTVRDTFYWTPIQALNYYEDAPVYQVDFGRSWTAICTGNHRWFGFDRDGTPCFQTLDEMTDDFQVQLLLEEDPNIRIRGQLISKKPAGNCAVWCPTTEFGTWIMRQGDDIILTGNSLNMQGGYTLQKTAQGQGIKMTVEEATNSIKAWRDDTAYGAIYRFQLQIIADANKYDLTVPGSQYKHGVVWAPSGRRLFMPKFPSTYRPNDPPGVKGPDAVSFYWQSTEADAMKIAMRIVMEEGVDAHPEWDLRLGNMCHDELNADCKEEYALEAAALIQDAMRRGMSEFLKNIPVDDPKNEPKKSVVGSWADK